MRELQATKAILDEALLKARQREARRITSLRLAIGEIAELDRIAMQNHWNDLSKGTLAEGAQLHFQTLPAEVQCMACFQKYHPENGGISCPFCGSRGAKVLRGEEFHIESIELDNE
ncbi:MAG TPA: hydrogenase maturation nickel metallochaperone HypA [Anaerolineales bacterium]|nr:hydrogenase maturation nickel metallochaperone HypA [Anaerolineales bacterium]